jgi:protocatechuate 3,4-dioxygenase, beta subunit
MARLSLDRRDLLRMGLAGAGLLALGRTRLASAQPHDMEPPAGLSLGPRARLTPPAEPGEPMVVSGVLFAPDGRAPVPGVTLYAYHTDARGLYAPDGDPPRLRGWMRTGADGGYELRSVRPAPYPGRTIPAHVHFNAWGAGYPRQWFEQLEFEGDPILTPERVERSRRLGRFGFVRPLARDKDGVWRCTFDLRLSRRSNY